MSETRALTVAAVREPPGADHVEVAFLESARFYRLPRTHPRFAAALELLRAAERQGGAVAVTLVEAHGEEIAAVEDA